MDLAIETRGLEKVYEKKIHALKGVDLQVPKGVVFGLFGPNGAGKTTLLSILTGIILPTKGEAYVLGIDAIKESLRVRERVGVLPEGFGFYEHLSGLENLIYLAMLDGLSREEARERAEKILDEVGLCEKKNVKVKEYSRGMRQRLGVAQAVLKDPELILLDEPTQGIDPQGVAWFKNFVVNLRQKGKTILISTHLLQEVGTLCSHAAIIYRGKILTIGSFEEISKRIREESNISAVFIYPNAFMAENAYKALVESGFGEVRVEAEKLYIIGDPEKAESMLSEKGIGVPSRVNFPSDWHDIFVHYIFFRRGDME
ncbi:MAG: ABC transporter ATP-binding protein [Thermoprotei archaeon]|nr:MAG: ABC transporter ATP-binding protein [Thermoprotei archaeon]